MRVATKGVVLVLLLLLAFAANAYAAEYFAGYLFPRVIPRPYFEMVSAAIAGGLAASALSAYPLVHLYSSQAWLAGLFVASPVVLLRASDAIQNMGKNEARIMVMSWVEMLVYPLAILAGVWLASKLSHRHGKSAA